MELSKATTPQERQDEIVSQWITGTMERIEREPEFFNREHAEFMTRVDYTAIEPRICLTAGCFEPMSMIDESGDCKRHAIEAWLDELSREEDPNTRIYIITHLISLGWVAEVAK